MANNLLASVVKGVRIETAFTPAFEASDPFAESPPSPVASLAGQLLRPKVTLLLAGGSTYPIAPYGDPGPSKWPIVQAVLIVVGLGLAGYLLSRSLK